MNSQTSIKSASSLTSWILWVTTVHLAVGIVIHTAWLMTGSESWLRCYFDYEGTLIFVAFYVLEVLLSVAAYRQFSSDQPLHSAWFFIVLAASCHLLGGLLKHLLSANTYINPFHYLSRGGVWDAHAADLLRAWGTVIAGPMQMALLAWGLFYSLRVYKKYGLLGRLRAVDWVLIGSGTVYTLIIIYQIVGTILHHWSEVTLSHAFTWPNDLLLNVLLFEAIFLRRSAADMGWGFIAKVWGAFAVAIFLTTLANACSALAAYGYLPWPEYAFIWYIWYPASAAYVLGPAYQVEASKTARARLQESLEAEEPVRA